jgi:hypothetical protein
MWHWRGPADQEVDAMRPTTARVLIGAGIVLGGLVVSPVPGASAGVRSTVRVIGPRQTFFGLVNGAASGAKITVVCPEAVQPHEMGHPANGQTIAVRSPAPSTTASASTGTKATSIVAEFSTPSATAASSVVFARYGSKQIPTTLLLPCIGSGTIVFSPVPTSASARSETMAVTYVTPCVGVCADKN